MAKLEEIIDGCKEGKRDAQKHLYEMFSPRLLAVCLRYTKNRMEAEDYLHESFIKIFDKRGQFENKGSLEGWMRRVTVNTILESFRKTSKYQFVDESGITIVADIEEADDLDEPAMGLGEIYELVEQLPERYKLVFKLYILERYTHEEISKQLGISVGTSKSNLARARQWLQKRIVKKKAEMEKSLWEI